MVDLRLVVVGLFKLLESIANFFIAVSLPLKFYKYYIFWNWKLYIFYVQYIIDEALRVFSRVYSQILFYKDYNISILIILNIYCFENK